MHFLKTTPASNGAIPESLCSGLWPKKKGDRYVMRLMYFPNVLIGLWTAFCFSGILMRIYTNRCIVHHWCQIDFIDLPTAPRNGAIIGELAYMGFGVLVPEVLFLRRTWYLWYLDGYQTGKSVRSSSCSHRLWRSILTNFRLHCTCWCAWNGDRSTWKIPGWFQFTLNTAGWLLPLLDLP